MKYTTIAILLLVSTMLRGQADTTSRQKPELSFFGFVDVFYAYDNNQPGGSARQPFLFNHNRHNEFNVNLALARISLDHPRYRASVAVQTGTYPNDNYAAEPGLLKSIFEAYAGVALSDNRKLWLDVGVLPSHIGFESAISTENPTLTRSLLAENSPYFLTGARLVYQPNDDWLFTALVANGWQRIQRVEGNSLLSFGAQVNYSPGDALTINWSTFIGTDDPDATRRLRYFNNLYGLIEASERLSLTVGFDVGAQQQSRGSSDYDTWLSPIVIGRLALTKQWAMTVRVEYYQDREGVLTTVSNPDIAGGLQATGISVNVDYAPASMILCRLETRWLRSPQRQFITPSGADDDNVVIAASIAVRFER